MEVAKITSKGQITIPISIRRKLELNEGDKVLFIYKPEGVLMVNPNTMQGGYTGDVVEAAETEMAAEAIAALKQRETTKSPPAAAASIDPPQAITPENDDDKYITKKPVTEAVQEPVSRPVPPPVEEPEKSDSHISGLNLGSLLDDIRSIGSNI